METEAKTMEYARSHGYPVPAISELSGDGTEVAMERIEGPVMLTVLSRRPWSIRSQGRLLADLHRRLHRIPAPQWVRDAPSGHGDSLVHLDLHPLNVIMSARGPVVIDWPNASRGEGATDIALTWLLLASGDAPTEHLWTALLDRFRGALIAGLLSGCDRPAVEAELPGVVAWKTADPNMSERERGAMQDLVRRLG
jgi:tRNA A-37 threonylcarbamoyl transferase component Bud32